MFAEVVDQTWVTFWPDVLVAVIGAGLTVTTGLATFFITRARARRQVVMSLSADLGARRALVPNDGRLVPNAVELQDYGRASLSVLDIRARIRHASDRVGASRRIQVHLSNMTAACNRYLELSAADPPRYWRLLNNLSNDLNDSLEELSRTLIRLKTVRPGSTAF